VRHKKGGQARGKAVKKTEYYPDSEIFKENKKSRVTSQSALSGILVKVEDI
jgi:hypothetical protein